jgi:hypothetical protein
MGCWDWGWGRGMGLAVRRMLGLGERDERLGSGGECCLGGW